MTIRRQRNGDTAMQMSHTRLLVSNFQDCFCFYRDVMEFPITWGDEHGSYADFDAGGHSLSLFLREPMAEAIGAESPRPKPEQQDCVCLVFAVEDVDEEYQTLVAKGVLPINEPHDRKDWGIRCFHFRDPDGNLIEVNKEIGIGGE
ncbi:MAG: VOC family protein, partial [Anaerolineaceae bacterium]|nr:VOC family protein [Anaerolineaceae bacterium]